MMSYVLEYAEAVQDGKILANDYIKAMYSRLADEALNPGKYHLDTDISDAHIDFIETFCKQSQGVMGAPLELELFQKAKLEATFGFVDDNDIRQFTEVDDFRGRKNGKTTEMAAVSLDLLCNDGEGAPEIYFIATKIDQAKKGFDEAVRMMKHSPSLSKHLRKRASDIYFRHNEGIIKPLASDVKKLDSYNSHAVVVDELGAITNRRIYDDMKQSTSSRRQPLVFCISTNNFVRGGIYDAQLKYGIDMLKGTVKDEHFLFLYYALMNKDQWLDPKYWIMANPGLGPIKRVEKLQQAVDKAKQDPAYKPTVLVKDFNLNENENAAWLRSDAAINKTIYPDADLRDAYCVGGCDLSSTYDLTCATLLLKKNLDGPWIVLQKYFLPESRLEEIDKQNEPEAPYRLWADQGWLTVCEGTQVRYSDVTEWFVSMVRERELRPLWVGYDRALAGYWAEEMISYGFDMEKIAQGAKTWTYPFKSLKAEFQAHNIIYQDNPMLLWCLMNTRVKSLNAEGIESQMPVKIKSNKRIDGVVSLLNAYTCMKGHEEEYMQAVQMAERREE